MLNTLIELQRLKRLDRTGWTLRGLPNGTESVAAHSFGVTVTAMMLADQMRARGLDVNTERVLRMAVLHDWAETRVGDLPRTASHYFGADARRLAEQNAFADIVDGLDNHGTDYTQLHEEYETRESLEARIVKAADIIDLLVQAYALERAGASGLDEFWTVTDHADFGLPPIAKEIVTNLMAALVAERNKLD
ncbi:MAG TPA: HD family hydrolase [Pyrinomonadaceae bacterium]|nr:HD family hydrolase [Pyrinomonadaceae bacterium]